MFILHSFGRVFSTCDWLFYFFINWIPVHFLTYGPVYSLSCSGMITSRLCFGSNWGPKSPSPFSFSPCNLFSFPPPTSYPSSHSLYNHHILFFFFAFRTYPVIPEVLPPPLLAHHGHSWQSMGNIWGFLRGSAESLYLRFPISGPPWFSWPLLC